MKYKSLKITEESHNKLKKYCVEKHLKINDWISEEIAKLIDQLEKKNEK